MKTLKTLIVEAWLTYFYARDRVPYIQVNWGVLDKAEGVVPNVGRDSDNVILNLASNSVVGFNLTENLITFNCSFGGVDSHCRIPTCSISAVYDRDNGRGMTFEVLDDYQEEQSEKPEIPSTEQKLPKKPRTVSHLKVIK